MNTDSASFIHVPRMHIVFLLNNSVFMRGIPIDQLNDIMKKVIKVVKRESEEKEVNLSIRVIVYNSSSDFIEGNTFLGENHTIWTPIKLSDCDCADLAGAIHLSRNALRRPFVSMGDCRPIIILISNGIADNIETFDYELDNLKNLLKGKIVRIAIAVKGSNRKVLSNFASIGWIFHDDGSLEENVPLVLDGTNLREGALNFLG